MFKVRSVFPTISVSAIELAEGKMVFNGLMSLPE